MYTCLYFLASIPFKQNCMQLRHGCLPYWITAQGNKSWWSFLSFLNKEFKKTTSGVGRVYQGTKIKKILDIHKKNYEHSKKNTRIYISMNDIHYVDISGETQRVIMRDYTRKTATNIWEVVRSGILSAMFLWTATVMYFFRKLGGSLISNTI